MVISRPIGHDIFMMLFVAALLAGVEVVVVTTGIDARDSTMWRWRLEGQVAVGEVEHAPGASPHGLVVVEGSQRTVVVTRRTESVVSAEVVSMPLTHRGLGRATVLATGAEPLQGPVLHEGRLAYVRVLDEGTLSYDIVAMGIDGNHHQVLAHADGYLVPVQGRGQDPLRYVVIHAGGAHQGVVVHDGQLVVEQDFGVGVFRSPTAIGALHQARWAIERVEQSAGIIVIDGIDHERVIAGSGLRLLPNHLIYAGGKSGVVRSEDHKEVARTPVVGVARPVADLPNGDIIVELDRGWAEPRQLWWLPRHGVPQRFNIPARTMATVLTTSIVEQP
jgi:hypothetical protein